MACKECKKKNVIIQLVEEIVLFNDDSEVKMNITSCDVKTAVSTNWIKKTKTNIVQYTIIASNFNKVKAIVDAGVSKITIDGEEKINFELFQITKDKFRIIIKG